MKVEKYDDFIIDESFLKSGRAPLYHFTYSYYLNTILNENRLKIGDIDNPIKNEYYKIISFTRDKNMISPEHRKDMNVRLEFDTEKLRNDYRLIPYDFYIHQKSETNPKSSILRIKNVEFEEVCLRNIDNLNKYLTKIEFIVENDSEYYLSIVNLKNYLLKYSKIEIYYNGEIQKL